MNEVAFPYIITSLANGTTSMNEKAVIYIINLANGTAWIYETAVVNIISLATARPGERDSPATESQRAFDISRGLALPRREMLITTPQVFGALPTKHGNTQGG